MQIQVHDIIATQFISSLNNLKTILNKANTYCQNKHVDFSVLLQTRLAPDMFPLNKQIQIACDNAKGAVARLSGQEPPVFEDKETTFDEFMQRINKTIQYLQQFNPQHFNQFESKRASFPWNPGQYLEGKEYLTSFAIPNFYFHLSMAYAILRNNGVDLGKTDFLGQLNWKK